MMMLLMRVSGVEICTRLECYRLSGVAEVSVPDRQTAAALQHSTGGQ